MKKNILTERKIMSLMLEEYSRHISSFLQEINTSSYTGKEDKESLLSQDLKVRHNKTKLLYTVSSFSPYEIILKTPEGEKIRLSAEEFEKEYDLA